MSHPNPNRDSLDPEKKKLYDLGYSDAARAMVESLEKIILEVETERDFLIEVSTFVLGTRIILSGGTAQEAKEVTDIFRYL